MLFCDKCVKKEDGPRRGLWWVLPKVYGQCELCERWGACIEFSTSTGG